MVVDLQLVDAVLQRLEPAVEMLGNGARVNAGQEFGACEVGKAAGSIAGRDFFELAVFVFSDAEEDYAATGIGGHWDGTLRVHTGCLCSASFARESGAESPAQAESLPHCKWPISRHRLKPVPPKSVLLDRQSPGGVDLDHHRTLEQFDADYQARGLGLAEHDTLKALERTID